MSSGQVVKWSLYLWFLLAGRTVLILLSYQVVKCNNWWSLYWWVVVARVKLMVIDIPPAWIFPRPEEYFPNFTWSTTFWASSWLWSVLLFVGVLTDPLLDGHVREEIESWQRESQSTFFRTDCWMRIQFCNGSALHERKWMECILCAFHISGTKVSSLASLCGFHSNQPTQCRSCCFMIFKIPTKRGTTQDCSSLMKISFDRALWSSWREQKCHALAYTWDKLQFTRSLWATLRLLSGTQMSWRMICSTHWLDAARVHKWTHRFATRCWLSCCKITWLALECLLFSALKCTLSYRFETGCAL